MENNEAIGSSIRLNHDIERQKFEGRDLSKFDQDVLKILCAVLNNIGPQRFTAKDVEQVDIDELVVEHDATKDMFIVMMVKPHGGLE